MAKALGAPGDMHWHDAEVVSESSGRPLMTMRGTVLARASELGVTSCHLSLSHDAGIASAVVVLEGTLARRTSFGDDSDQPPTSSSNDVSAGPG